MSYQAGITLAVLGPIFMLLAVAAIIFPMIPVETTDASDDA